MGSFLESLDGQSQKGCYAGKPKHPDKTEKLAQRKLVANQKFHTPPPQFCVGAKK